MKEKVFEWKIEKEERKREFLSIPNEDFTICRKQVWWRGGSHERQSGLHVPTTVFVSAAGSGL